MKTDKYVRYLELVSTTKEMIKALISYDEAFEGDTEDLEMIYKVLDKGVITAREAIALVGATINI